MNSRSNKTPHKREKKKKGSRNETARSEVFPKWQGSKCDRPEMMPHYYFPGAVRKDYNTAIRADTSRHRTSCFVDMERFWYFDVWFLCQKCGREFCWSAKTQQIWFERFGLWTQAYPKLCPECRRKRNRLNRAKDDYAKLVRDIDIKSRKIDVKLKHQVIETIGRIEELSEEPLTRGYIELRDLLERQIEKRRTE